VIDLDRVEALGALDRSDMLGTVAALPGHCREAYDAARGLELPSAEGVNALTYCGMGGSAVAGDVVRAVFRDRLNVPVEVNRGHELPRYAGPHTLVVVSSFSGNTAETLSGFREAVRRGCRVVAVTSGGTLAAEAADAGVPVVPVPGGFQPRAALGHLGFASLGALEAMGLLPDLTDDVEETVTELEGLVERLGPHVPAERNPSKALAARIGDRVPIVWGAEGIGSVAAMRWKTQLNENGKVPAFWSAMSELDHNEVVGWIAPSGHPFSLIALRHDGEHPEIAERFPLSYQIARDAGMENAEVRAAGRSTLARLMSLIIVGDYTSVYVGLRRGVDPTPVVVLDRLKAALAGASS
jgi:glucose/mannose-6-phosphate isomerase